MGITRSGLQEGLVGMQGSWSGDTLLLTPAHQAEQPLQKPASCQAKWPGLSVSPQRF